MTGRQGEACNSRQSLPITFIALMCGICGVFNFGTGETTQIAKIEKTLDLGLAVSPDEREVLFAQVDVSGTNLMLIENFR